MLAFGGLLRPLATSDLLDRQAEPFTFGTVRFLRGTHQTKRKRLPLNNWVYNQIPMCDVYKGEALSVIDDCSRRTAAKLSIVVFLVVSAVRHFKSTHVLCCNDSNDLEHIQLEGQVVHARLFPHCGNQQRVI